MEKRNKTVKVIIIVLLFMAVLSVFPIGIIVNNARTFTQVDIGDQEPHIEVSDIDGEVPLVTDVVLEWVNGKKTATELYKEYSAHTRIYASNSVLLYYSVFDIPYGTEITSQEIELSENSTFDNAKIYKLGYDKRKIQFDYLLTDKTYYYRITAFLSDGTQIQASGEFKTLASPRILMFEGPRNVRDIGGWETEDGKRIKQGMLYRGSELDGVMEKKYTATENDIELMLNELGIKTEVDLRFPSDAMKDMLGPTVTHNYYKFLAYNDCFKPNGEAVLRDVIRDLAVPENYPIYLHCSYGADRTGTMCFFIEAILGLSEENLYKEWELSILCNGGAFYEEMDLFLRNVKALSGDTMQEKVCNYLISIGVTHQELDSIREILLED